MIDEHQHKQLEENARTKSAIHPSTISSSSMSGTLIHHQGEQQQQQQQRFLSLNSMKTISSGKQKETKLS